jgi:hypothetical protein
MISGGTRVCFAGGHMHVSNSACACLEMNLLLQVSSLACLNLHVSICVGSLAHNMRMPDSLVSLYVVWLLLLYYARIIHACVRSADLKPYNMLYCRQFAEGRRAWTVNRLGSRPGVHLISDISSQQRSHASVCLQQQPRSHRDKAYRHDASWTSWENPLKKIRQQVPVRLALLAAPHAWPPSADADVCEEPLDLVMPKSLIIQWKFCILVAF